MSYQRVTLRCRPRSINVEATADVFAEFGCPWGVGLRVANELAEIGERPTRMLYGINVSDLRARLQEVDVEVV